MDLIERYLAAIGRQLPSGQVADIKAELRDVLLSRVEEQEAARDRPLTRDEVETLLVDFGNPLVVASRYRKTQHLIGPEVFPFWWAAVKLMLSIVAGIYLVLIAVGVFSHKTPAEFNRAVPSIWYVAVYLFGVITLVFAGIERFGKTPVLQHWKPRNLPPAMGKSRSRFELAAEVTWDTIFILWWLGLWRFRDFMPDPTFLTVDLAPVWMAWKWPIIGYASLEIAVDLLAIARPGWMWINGAASIARYLVGISILSMIAQAGHWLIVSGANIPPHAKSVLQTNFDLGTHIGILATVAVMALQIALVAWRLRLVRQAQTALATAA